MSIRNFSRIAASNATVDNINFSENQAANTLNDSARELMADIAEWRDDNEGDLLTTGSTNAYVLATRQTVPSLVTGVQLAFRASFANTGAATLNVDSLGARSIRKFLATGEAALSANDIVLSGHYTVRYDTAANSGAGAWILLNPSLGLGALALKNTVATADIDNNSILPSKLALGAWTTVASAATVDLGAQTSRNIVISGTTGITSFGSTATPDNVPFNIRFSGSLTLTHSANLICPGAANITTAAGDLAAIVQEATGTWRIINVQRAATPSNLLPVGTAANNLVQLDGSARLPAVDGSQLTGITRLQQGTAVNTTSGTAVDFTGIPSWAKRITINFHGLSTNSSSPPIIQIGISAGIQTTGYQGDSIAIGPGTAVALWTSQFTLGCNSTNWFGTNAVSGNAVLTLLDAATGLWCFSSSLGNSVNAYHYIAAGSKSLSGILDRVRLTTDGGTGTFDAGSVNILIEG